MRQATRFAAQSATIAVLFGLLLLPLALSQGAEAVRWGGIGWLAMTAIGILGGAWIASRHGTAGPGFLVAFGVCMLTRLTCLIAGALVATSRGTAPVGAYLAGLLAGYVAPQAFEIFWLLSRTRKR